MGLYPQKYPKLQFAHGQFCSKHAKVVANGPSQGEDGGISQAPLQTQRKMQAEASEMLQRESRGQTPAVPAESGKTTRALCSLHAPTRQSSGQQMSARSKPLGLR